MSNEVVIIFATSNKHKVTEAELILSEFDVRLRTADLKGFEVQSEDLSVVAAQAARNAAAMAGSPTIVEDSGLFVDSLKGFPGPYSSYVCSKLGVSGVLTLLGDAPQRSASFRSVVAYCQPGDEPRLFEGVLRGLIVARPSGSHGFGFDPIFAPEGTSRTLAEASLEEKCRISHRAISMRKFGAWFALSMAKV